MVSLLSWLGKTDIDNMRRDEHAAISTIATQYSTPFDQIVILANAWESDWEVYLRWLKKRMAIIGRPEQKIFIKSARIQTPIHFPSILTATDEWLSKLSVESDLLCINLTSGTPAMSTVSVLLGKAKDNTRFLQTTPSNEVIEVEIPVDFCREYVKSVAKNVASKASHEPHQAKALDDLVAFSPTMKDMVSKAKKLARSELSTLILGETGAGKEVIAKAIHADSLRADKPFRTVNCGALPESLIDTTLFGHVKGAFTGANSDHAGLFEQADKGTLFLDEVGELSQEAQVKLLRALQLGEITRVGDKQTINVDVRVIAATHRDLLSMVNQGTFREDLFYRLAVGIIEVPSLRNRQEDIEPLVKELEIEINGSSAKHPEYKSKNISKNGINFIKEQAWPGNIRELWNTLNRAFLFADGHSISELELKEAMLRREHKPDEQEVSLSLGEQLDINQLIDNYKKKYVLAALKATGYSLTKATEMLGLNNHQTLKGWMEKLGIEIPKRK